MIVFLAVFKMFSGAPASGAQGRNGGADFPVKGRQPWGLPHAGGPDIGTSSSKVRGCGPAPRRRGGVAARRWWPSGGGGGAGFGVSGRPCHATLCIHARRLHVL